MYGSVIFVRQTVGDVALLDAKRNRVLPPAQSVL